MSELPPDYAARVLADALAEDLAGGVDVTSVATIPEGQRSTGRFVSRQAGTLAGLEVVVPGLQALGLDVERVAADGDRVLAGDVVLVATGPTRTLLTVERTALNLLGHLSGVATLTARWADEVAGTGARIRDTRKTTPGLRLAEKYAVRCGGGTNHRLSLSDEALIKDNHVLAAGGITAALDAVRAQFPGLVCEVECDTLAQVAEAADAGAELILLDNMDVVTTGEAVRLVGGRARTEASGGLSLDTAHEVALTGVDFLSVGALTHSSPVLDIGLDLSLDAALDRDFTDPDGTA
jgi:nicotinate-nucleotide pyrophosphorylase (carboxylating)